MTPAEGAVIVKKVKTSVDDAAEQCITIITYAVKVTDNDKSKWLIAARIANRVWSWVHHPAITATLKDIGDDINADA